MTTIELIKQTANQVTSPEDAARVFGLVDVDAAASGRLPFAIHNKLVNSSTFSSDDLETVAFEVQGHSFYCLLRPSDSTWDRVGLRGHQVVSDPTQRIEALSRALEVIGERPNALDLVRRFISTFVWVEGVSDTVGEPVLTSCSLPDLPLAVFLSDFALRHIPPLTVSESPSTRLLAENIYHESVHQYVNFRILTEELFVEEYDSRTSPRVPIAWRKTSIERNQAWELDRVLHAATVYSQLLDWRWYELSSDVLTEMEESSISEATTAALVSANYLSDALMEHVNWLTAPGALMVGRLAQSIEQRSHLLADRTSRLHSVTAA